MLVAATLGLGISRVGQSSRSWNECSRDFLEWCNRKMLLGRGQSSLQPEVQLTSAGPSSGFLGAEGEGVSQDAWPRGRAAHIDCVSDLCFTSISLTLPTCEIDLGLAWEHLV